ncbi:MAG: hypothetical protein J6W13_13720 [Salinivirgaceae bacterium]|nr:hypothetical protein [Salinivirgaceae bacterium]
MKRCVLQLCSAILLLAASGLIYILFRPDTTLLFCTLVKAGFAESLYQLRAAASVGLPYWVVYCLPNALWVAAYILITDMVLTGWTMRPKLLTASVIMIVGVASEMLQSAALLPGTFDVADIVAYTAPYSLYVVWIFTKNKIIVS